MPGDLGWAGCPPRCIEPDRGCRGRSTSISHKGPARWASERYHAGRATRRLRPDETSMQSRTADRPSELEAIADQILANYGTGPRAMHHLGGYELPQQAEVEKCVETIRALLLPGFVGVALVGATSDDLRAF